MLSHRVPMGVLAGLASLTLTSCPDAETSPSSAVASPSFQSAPVASQPAMSPRYQAPAGPMARPSMGAVPQPMQEQVRVRFVDSAYPEAPGGTSGVFRTGQDADIMLSGLGFNNAGGALLFNHPMGIASDGRHLALADTYNNRVLVWNELPDGNTPPDFVLGQKDFTGNDSGNGDTQMNFPVGVVFDDEGRLIVADTENDRLLVWQKAPTRSGQAADMIVQGGARPGTGAHPFTWPWGVWAGCGKLVVSSTRSASVLVWNEFPVSATDTADLILRGGGDLGTPRHITSDCRSLIVGDHNPFQHGAKPRGQTRGGSFVWKEFPTASDEAYDFFMSDPTMPGGGPWLRGNFTPEGKLALIGGTLSVWNDGVPKDANDPPDVSIRNYDFHGGDHVASVSAGGRLYIVTGNTNKIVVYNGIPTSGAQKPDFAIGAPDIDTDTLQTHFIISNPVPVSDGESLFVASDFDRKLYVWRKRPDKSGAHPDVVYDLPDGPWDVEMHGGRLIAAGNGGVYVWNKPPLHGEMPDKIYRGRVGSVQVREIRGVAFDDHYFYLADKQANKIYVWEGLPQENQPPAFTLDVDSPARLSSDGTWLAVTPYTGHFVELYKVKDLASSRTPFVIGQSPNRPGQALFNMAMSAQVHDGRLFVVDNSNGRVHVWNDVNAAIAGRPADALLGTESAYETTPETGRDKLRYPAALHFDGEYLWVGETKFSERLLRYSPAERL